MIGIITKITNTTHTHTHARTHTHTHMGWVTVFGLLFHLRMLRANQVNPILHASGVAKSSTSFGWGKGGNVTSGGWYVTLCDPIWHVSSRSGDRLQSLSSCCTLLVAVIVELVRSGYGGDNGKPYRPSKDGLLSDDELMNETIHECLTMLMDECWAEREHVRPSFDSCLDYIYKRTGNK